MGHGESTSATIVRAVAAYDGTRPTDLEPPLHEAIDTDALDALFPTGSGTGAITLEFTYRGYTILVGGPDDIEISPTNPSDGAATDSTEDTPD